MEDVGREEGVEQRACCIEIRRRLVLVQKAEQDEEDNGWMGVDGDADVVDDSGGAGGAMDGETSRGRIRAQHMLLREESVCAASAVVLVPAGAQRDPGQGDRAVHGVRDALRERGADAAVGAVGRGRAVVGAGVRGVRAGGVQERGGAVDVRAALARAVRADVCGAAAVRSAADHRAELRAAPERRARRVARRALAPAHGARVGVRRQRRRARAQLAPAPVSVCARALAVSAE